MAHATETLLDRYVIESLIGSGAMGKVYRATDTRLRRSVALKVMAGLAPGAEAEAALREARAAAAIVHPNVTAIFDADYAGSTSFIVMELVPGTSLRAHVGDASVPVGVRVRWLVDIAAALHAAHQAGVVHRDVKPENVIVRDDGMVKVLDFGVARVATSSTPARGMPSIGAVGQTGLVGTPAYMSPEQIHGARVDGRADQFAWGVLAYELLSGQLPWRSAKTPVALLRAIIDEVPAPLPADVPDEVAAAVLRALSKKAEARFPSMSDAAHVLAPFSPAPLASPTSELRDRTAIPPPEPAPKPTEPPPSQIRVAPLAYSVAPPALEADADRGTPPPPSLRSLGAAIMAPPSSGPSSARLRTPDFVAPVDLDGHLALLPTDASCKGMFLMDVARIGAKSRSVAELHELAGLPDRRYVAFRDYPMADHMRLAVAASRLAYPGIPIGQGLRRIGQSAFDAVIGTHIGKTLFGVLGRDAERLLARWPKAYELLLNFGNVTAEPRGPGLAALRMRAFPAFLETYQIGVLEGALRHCGAGGRVRIALASLSDAVIEIELA